MSVIRCSAIAMTIPNLTSVFCMTSERECWVPEVFLPAGYDNAGTGPSLHTCYTTAKPLFDKAAALAACNNNPVGCCPWPFVRITNVGCVFTSSWFFPILPYPIAQAFCKSLWPTGDLYSKPSGVINFNALNNYLDSTVPLPIDVWVGATSSPGLLDYRWVDGSTVSSSNYASFPDIPAQPDKRIPLSPFATPGVDCLLVMRISLTHKLGDDWCYKPAYYLCEIK
ncbi:uncharacterized protein LOC125177930 [Hyalella azteca]|uniref:Uncharacterized protein LOC125177930 n=1 Tax=Hyalella azteca TaxID=294128 RepID=A0A979FI25_HYAAZ|nr:uncharacterized protein LOC125177930 [Hyalella azteca]